MPQIPGLETGNLLPQGSIQGQATPDAFGAGVAASVGHVAQAGAEVGDALYRVEQDQGRIWAYDAASKEYLNLKKSLDEQVNALDPTDPEFTKKAGALSDNFQKEAEASTQRLVQEAPSKSARRLVASHMAQTTHTLTGHAMNEQARVIGQYVGQLEVDGMKNDQDRIAADPSDANFTQVVEARKQHIGGLQSVDPSQKIKWIGEAEHGLALTQTQVLASTNPRAFLAAVHAEGGQVGTGKGAVPGGTPSAPAAPSLDIAPPVNHGASFVKAYTADQVKGIAEKTKAPSPYDDLFKAAATKYGLDPAELKMRAVAESGLNAGAVSPAGATGIMQLTPETAKGLGVDPTKPAEAIEGAAKLLSQYKVASGGDASKIDQMYYGGPSGTNWGKNTLQYAANLASVRAAMGDAIMAPEGAPGGRGGPSLGELPQVQALTEQDIAGAKPPIAGWGKLTWPEKVATVRQAEAALGNQLATDRGQMDRDLADAHASLMAGKDYPGLDGPRFSGGNLLRLYGAVDGPRKYDELTYERGVSGFIGHVEQMPYDQAVKFIKDQEPKGGPEFANKQPVFQQMIQALNRTQEMRNKDYMSWAQGAFPDKVQPLNTQSPEGFAASLKQRVNMANTGLTDFKADAHLFSKDEANQLGDTLNAQPPQTQIAYLKALKTGAGDAWFNDAVQQIAPKNTMLAFAASTAFRGGTVQTAGGAQSGEMVGKYILEGAHILQGKDLNDPSKTGRPLNLDDKQIRAAFWAAVGPDAFNSSDAQHSAQAADDTYQAVKNYVAADLFHRSGLNPNAVDSNMVANAVKAVTGGTAKSPSGDNLFVPWGMDEKWFHKAFATGVDAAIEKGGLKGSYWDSPDSFTYRNWDEGRYQVLDGAGKPVYGKNGALVVDLRGMPLTAPPLTPGMPDYFAAHIPGRGSNLGGGH